MYQIAYIGRWETLPETAAAICDLSLIHIFSYTHLFEIEIYGFMAVTLQIEISRKIRVDFLTFI